ncbi:gamma carbonic anhydrase family protein [Thermus filiformis]|jgi:carbonic anhydrase/acetyltransferase-like protein (isoleucine patch superfamily)|uniref:Carbonic anhydrase n=1 Tax=Thermus filiformis TaxID=276 RepID=A0A0A2WW41_THEFI|nr:gamma carbonic anhydrase family protein [Thermus filiformis]KGQ22520.1 carbonic anhydrase [Thermus filiformis]
MAVLVALEGKEPRVHPTAFVAPTATLIGDVVVEEGASVWFGAVLRADFDRIVVGPGSCVQDNAVVHTAEGLPTLIGPSVTVAHLAYLEGCVVEEGALIGVGALVLQRARVGRGAVVAAGSVVLEGMEIPPETLVAGVPAQAKKTLSGSSRAWAEMAAREYRALSLRYRRTARLLDSGDT